METPIGNQGNHPLVTKGNVMQRYYASNQRKSYSLVTKGNIIHW